ncbi:MAG: hypothetical protein M1823_002936 [Watsoniomyces obsoletus]|nr:MAG: hypothetical protein M1823_002936 [Watsoniomyces obsoletus]
MPFIVDLLSEVDSWDTSDSTHSDSGEGGDANTLRDLVGPVVAQDSSTTLTEDANAPSSGVESPKRRRRRLFQRPAAATAEFNEPEQVQATSSWEIAELSTRPQAHRSNCHVRPPGLIYPKSAYEGWVPPLPASREHNALADFRRNARHGSRAPRPPTRDGHVSRASSQTSESSDFQQFKLNHFTIYKPDISKYPSEMAPLHHLCVKMSNNDYYFDGILSDGNTRHYVQRVPFKLMSIGGYCDTSQHVVGDQIWIQSIRLEGSDTWYQLCEPAPEYERYHVQFRWLADFAKHFTDYLHRHQGVSLRHFRLDFHRELMELHGHDEDFRRWLREYGDTDFRRVVTANTDFLYNQSVVVERRNINQPIWDEVYPGRLTAVKEQTVREVDTVVTPFVYECFKGMDWGKYLSVAKPRQETSKDASTPDPTRMDVDDDDDIAQASRHSTTGNGRAQSSSKRASFETNGGFGSTKKRSESEHIRKPLVSAIRSPVWSPRCADFFPLQTIRVGDVVGLDKDSDTAWKSKHDLWFAYVQGVNQSSSGRQSLSVIWLYAPSDTTCSTMHYPIPDELFFSDNCNCGDARLDPADVVCKPSVEFFGEPGRSSADYIVRQTYHTDEAEFVTLKRSHFTCHHLSGESESDKDDPKQKYKPGSTVLYSRRLPDNEKILEPAEVVEFYSEGRSENVRLRRLARRKRDCGGGPEVRPNELVYTDDIFSVPVRRIDRKCYIRFYTADDQRHGKIPPPYSRDGTADAYYIICRRVGSGVDQQLEPIQLPFTGSLIQGFDPLATPPKPPLRGMDLYCGGGNFGRGLEEGGAVHNQWAVDYNRDAIHTYRANLDRPEETALYYGSVNDLLAQAIKGRYSEYVPPPGEVDFISAGSPCQGFSNVNQQRSNEKSLRNSSLVASVAAFVDFYRPKYALLENVVAMASKGKKNQDHNVFSQLLCALVGMGYQVQQFNLDAWSFGSPQSRSRLFVSIAAPGLPLPPHPPLSHSHPPQTRDRGLGVAANGLSFGLRHFETTPFEYVTAAEGAAGLPWVGDARTQTCIPHPDHRNSRHELNLKRLQIQQIPIAPRGQSFMTAAIQGRLGQPQLNEYRWDNKFKVATNSRCWKRVDPNALMPTITTAAQPSCGFTGTILHWDQHRLLTIMEARRAQSFPDQDVLVGHPAVQWKIVGNSVARTVALALGMSLREAWFDHSEGGTERGQVSTNVTVNTREAIEKRVSIHQSGQTRVVEVTQVEQTRRSKRRIIMDEEDEVEEEVQVRGIKKVKTVPEQDSTRPRTPPAALKNLPGSKALGNLLHRPNNGMSTKHNAVPTKNRSVAPPNTRTKSTPKKAVAGDSSAPIELSDDDENQVKNVGVAMSISPHSIRTIASSSGASFGVAPGQAMSISDGASPPHSNGNSTEMVDLTRHNRARISRDVLRTPTHRAVGHGKEKVARRVSAGGAVQRPRLIPHPSGHAFLSTTVPSHPVRPSSYHGTGPASYAPTRGEPRTSSMNIKKAPSTKIVPSWMNPRSTTTGTAAPPTTPTHAHRPSNSVPCRPHSHSTATGPMNPSQLQRPATTVSATQSQRPPSTANAAPSRSQPTATKPTPFGAQQPSVAPKPTPFGSQARSVGTKPTPFGRQPSSVAAKPASFGAQPHSVATKPSSSGTQSSSVATKPTPFGTQPRPVATKPAPFGPHSRATPTNNTHQANKGRETSKGKEKERVVINLID